MELPNFYDIRKLYVQARSGYGSATLSARKIGKQSAHDEFNEFIQTERDKAANAARLEGLREGWRQGAWYVFLESGAKVDWEGHMSIDDNPYETKDLT